jgi:quercetin dioxygenase-like cupin family protein
MKIIRCLVQPLAAAAISLLPVMPALGADATNEAAFVNARDIKWQNAPPSLPKGAKVGVLHGDPGKPGPFVMRLKAPAGFKIPPHWHSHDENLTIISGALYLGIGDKQKGGDAHALKTGGYHYLPAKTHHYAFTKAPTIVQVNGEGPFDITYINPDDDPQKAGKK